MGSFDAGNDYGSPEEALAKIDRDVAAAVERAQKATAWRQELETLRGSGSAERGAVEVQVESTGLITRLRISDDICDRGGRAVAHAVVDAISAAQADVSEKISSSSDATWGVGSDITAKMNEEIRQRFTGRDDIVDGGRDAPGSDINWG